MRTFASFVTVFVLAHFANAEPLSIELQPDTLDLSTAPTPSFEDVAGRRSICMESGTVLLNDHHLEHGTISVDIQNAAHRHFAHLVFNAEDAATYEAAYLRLHKSKQLDAFQYNPHINGESHWQLFAENQMSVDFGDGEWVTLQVAFTDDKAQVTVITNAGKFTHEINDLALDGDGDRIGVSTLFRSCFSNFTVDPQKPDLSAIEDPTYETTPGVISQWRLSPAMPFDEGAEPLLYSEDWEVVDADANGRLLISRYREKPSRGRYERNDLDIVYAGLSIVSDEARSVPLSFDVSDAGWIYLNGKLLIHVNNAFRAKGNHLFRGDFARSAQTLILPLESGRNELVFGLAERANGWAVAAEFLETEGLSFD